MWFLVVAVLLSRVHSAVTQGLSAQIHSVDTSVLLHASDACLTAFNANVSCTDDVTQLADDIFAYFNQTRTDALCQASCAKSLSAHRDAVKSACAADVQYYNAADGSYWLSTMPDDYLIYGLNVACLKTSNGTWCSHHDADGDCDECVAKTLQAQINSPFGTGNDVKAGWSSFTSSCGFTAYPTVGPTAALISTATPTATSCTGTSYKVQPTDDYYSIPKLLSVSTDQLLFSNSLPYDPSKFPKTGALCVENRCKVNVVTGSDDCDSIANANKITVTQLISWNLNLDSSCSNLSRFVNNTLCVSNPSGNYAAPSNSLNQPVSSPVPVPANIAPNTTTNCGLYYLTMTGDDCSISVKYGISGSDFRFLNPSINPTCTNMWAKTSYCVKPVGDIRSYPGYGSDVKPLPPFTPVAATQVPWINPTPTANTLFPVIPLASGTREDCWQYFWLNKTGYPDSETVDCWEIARGAGLERTELAHWNPSIDKNPPLADPPDYNYSCTLAWSVSYCVAVASPTPAPPATIIPPQPRASGEADNCVMWSLISSKVDCSMLVAAAGLTMDQFYQMNPSVKQDCSGLALGTNYCFGMGAILDDGSSPTTTAPTTTGPGGPSTSNGQVVTPTPIQPGMVANCNKFYEIQKGDGCDSIVMKNKISSSDIHNWNPGVGDDCRTLWPGYFLCISGPPAPKPSTTSPPATASPSPTNNSGFAVAPPAAVQPGIPKNCNKWIKQQDGVFCFDMAAKAGIPLDRLLALNPVLGADCKGLWKDYAYCIGTT